MDMEEKRQGGIPPEAEDTDPSEAVKEAIRKAREEAAQHADDAKSGSDPAENPGPETSGGLNTAGESPSEGSTENAGSAPPEDEEKTAWEEVLEDAQEEREAEAAEEKVPKAKSSAKDAQIEDLTDRLKRQMAEFENFRRRSEREKSQMFDMGARHVIERILPVIDNFERGLSGVDPETSDAFAEGMQMVYKQMMAAFTEIGVEPIEAVGQPFDPELHNAVMHVDDEAYGENEVAEELQKGYKYHDAVVRHSMVKVAN